LFLGGQCRPFAFGLFDVDRGRLLCGWARPSMANATRFSAGARFDLAVWRHRSLAGGVFVLALAFALEVGGGFPVAKRAGGDAETRQRQLAVSFPGRAASPPASAFGFAPVGGGARRRVASRSAPHGLAARARSDAALAEGGLGGGAGAGGSLERDALAEPLAHLGGGQPIPAAADAPAGEVAVELVGDRVGVPPLGVRAGERRRMSVLPVRGLR
jgi:hypothetical protein